MQKKSILNMERPGPNFHECNMTCGIFYRTSRHKPVSNEYELRQAFYHLLLFFVNITYFADNYQTSP